MQNKEITVRELGGEIWAQIMKKRWEPQGKELVSLEEEDFSIIINIILGVLAKHEHKVIINDADFPVSQLDEL